MKEKIKAALQQGYKNLGLKDEVFERVAEAAETFITDEAQIATFVGGAKSMLQMYQSQADKVRTELTSRIKSLENEKADLEARLKDGNNTDDVNIERMVEKKQEVPDIAALISEAVSKAVAPLQDKITAFESANTQAQAVEDALSRIDAWDYAKAYPKERGKAQAAAMELYDAYGKTWNADTLEAKIREKFTAEVSERGVDITKPLKSDNNGSGEKLDFSDHIKMLQHSGVKLPSESNE